MSNLGEIKLVLEVDTEDELVLYQRVLDAIRNELTSALVEPKGVLETKVNFR